MSLENIRDINKLILKNGWQAKKSRCHPNLMLVGKPAAGRCLLILDETHAVLINKEAQTVSAQGYTDSDVLWRIQSEPAMVCRFGNMNDILSLGSMTDFNFHYLQVYAAGCKALGKGSPEVTEPDDTEDLVALGYM